ncbi:flagellar basal body rod protein FlgC [Verrucomicrobia bacterium S94]|nr:flagellar basal body rod protein FlgC [Verrucomicrobia bacterium S94]
MTLMPGVSISASGLDAESRRMEIIANNVANAQTTRGPDGKVFQRKDVVFSQRLDTALGDGELGGVDIVDVVADPTPGRQVYRPGHPDADENGMLEMPNVNPVAEMVDMMSASRAFEANLSAMKTSRTMASKALGILSGK